MWLSAAAFPSAEAHRGYVGLARLKSCPSRFVRCAGSWVSRFVPLPDSWLSGWRAWSERAQRLKARPDTNRVGRDHEGRGIRWPGGSRRKHLERGGMSEPEGCFEAGASDARAGAFAPPGLGSWRCLIPRLAPWATFFRRLAAERRDWGTLDRDCGESGVRFFRQPLLGARVQDRYSPRNRNLRRALDSPTPIPTRSQTMAPQSR